MVLNCFKANKDVPPQEEKSGWFTVFKKSLEIQKKGTEL
jgi:hypothetical protein